MKIDVKINKVDAGKIVAFADVTLGGMFVVKGLKVVQGGSGNFVAMPNVKLNKPYTDKNGNEVQYQDTFFPISKEAREKLINAVLEAFGGEEDGDPF